MLNVSCLIEHVEQTLLKVDFSLSVDSYLSITMRIIAFKPSTDLINPSLTIWPAVDNGHIEG